VYLCVTAFTQSFTKKITKHTKVMNEKSENELSNIITVIVVYKIRMMNKFLHLRTYKITAKLSIFN
jgi:hypothetical protein